MPFTPLIASVLVVVEKIHPRRASSPTEVPLAWPINGNSIISILIQPLNAPLPIDVRVVGNLTDINLTQSAKAPASIDVIPSGSVKCSRPVQPRSISSPRVVFSKIISAKSTQYANASLPIIFVDAGILIRTIPEYANA